MRLRWTPAAADDLESIRDYLALHLPSFAQSTILEIYQTILALRSTPFRGRAGREEGTRELVMPRLPYIVVYRVKDNYFEILHIYHGAQHRP
jgi:toxin ParE1/3/4